MKLGKEGFWLSSLRLGELEFLRFCVDNVFVIGGDIGSMVLVSRLFLVFGEWFTSPLSLRQGNPISPLLFSIVTDVLGRMYGRGVSKGLSEGFKVGNELVQVSHLH